MAEKLLPFTIQFSAGSTIDKDAGILRGVTVAEIGEATGHFAFVDKEGRVLGVGGMDDAGNFKTATRQLPLAMDQQSLDTVVAAGKKAKRAKAREDHDDSVGARAGFADNFRIEDGKAVCDLAVFEAYRNRGVFVETADRTPELIGLSGDFKFTAEVKGDVALMRVNKIEAVDIVDRGALTHAGLFQAKAVDISKITNPPPQFSSTMAKPTTAPDLKAFKALCEEIASYRAEHTESCAAIDEAMAAIAPVPVKTPAGAPAPVPTAGNPDAAVPGADAKIAASVKAEVTKDLTATFSALVANEVTKAIAAAGVEFRKEMSALGIKPGAVPSAPAPADTPPAATLPTDFLELKASIAKERKITPTEATRVAQKEHPEAWTQYQVKLGIIKPKAA